MSFFYVLIAVLPIAALTALFAYSFIRKARGISGKKVLARNLIAFAVIAITVCAFTFSVSAAENDKATATAETSQSETAEASSSDSGKGLGLIAAAIVTGLSGVGGGIAVAAGAPAAIAATSEDPKAFGKALIFVALGESIALYGVVISILILNKI
ncbi:MAG: ATP synthase subunit C [Clostridiaceae bacterium]|nr:ATP synthase subunit C [Clostridiaceae bacterium]MDY5889655.1 ATP synthase subunit C [Oscillospiraceae bacterium]